MENTIAPRPSVTGIPLYHTNHSLIGRSTLLRPSKYRGRTSPIPEEVNRNPKKKEQQNGGRRGQESGCRVSLLSNVSPSHR
jgi:hypothetical protein